MNKLVGKTKWFLKHNGSTILTIGGAAGVITTAVVAVKETPKALYLLEQAKEEKGEDLTAIEKVKVAGPVYIPSIIIGASTIACIFGANTLNKRQQAALMSAYALLDNSYKEYKKKVTEMYGEDADKLVRNSIAKDKYEEAHIDPDEEDDRKRLFYDEFSEQYFRATTAEVLKAEYEVNREMAQNGGVALTRFYELLNIDKLKLSEDIGWSIGMLSDMYWTFWIDFDHEKVIMDDEMECTIIRMCYEPVVDFDCY